MNYNMRLQQSKRNSCYVVETTCRWFLLALLVLLQIPICLDIYVLFGVSIFFWHSECLQKKSISSSSAQLHWSSVSVVMLKWHSNVWFLLYRWGGNWHKRVGLVVDLHLEIDGVGVVSSWLWILVKLFGS